MNQTSNDWYRSVGSRFGRRSYSTSDSRESSGSLLTNHPSRLTLASYTFIYLFSFFLLADGLNTTGSVVRIVQNQHIAFSFLQVGDPRAQVLGKKLIRDAQSTYLGIAQAATSTFSCYAFWYLQRHWTFKTKRMFQITNVRP